MPFQRLHDWAGSGFGPYNRIEDFFPFEVSLMYFFNAELATRGFAISFLTPASVALPGSFLALFLGMYPPWYRSRSHSFHFGTKGAKQVYRPAAARLESAGKIFCCFIK
jgi:hypothetical protein